MNNIIECKLESTYKEIYTGLWQHDYGQILRITGVEFPKAVEIQFSLNEKSGSTITRIGTTVDGVTEVQIPNELLKNDGRTYDYCIYAYIYLTDETSGSTEYEIVLRVKSRTKPENPSEEPLPEPNIFHETVAAVNASAGRAEKALEDVEEIRDNLNLDLSEKITRPQTAEVGQVLAVKEIDESGKPTVFEAEDVKVPTKTSQLENDSGFLTEHQDISGKLDKEKLPEAIDDALAQAKESGEFNGKDGANGKDGEKGEKGDPGETTYIENPYDDTEIKKEIAAKVGYSEVVGNQLLMYADDTKEKLLATLELPSDVEDVQINGTSIVENGIADIPAYWANTVNGIEFLNTKTKKIQLRLVNPSKKDISNRTAGIYQAINTSNYDYTVKSAMSAPIADTAGMIKSVYHYPAWTADEQKRARERMGVVSEDELELIAIIKPSADEIVGLCILDFSGQAIHKNFYIIAEIGIVDKNEVASELPKISLSVNGYKNWEYQELRKAAGELKYMIVHTAVTKSSGFVYLSTSIPLNNDFDSTTNMNGLGLGVSPYCNRNYMNGITKIEIGARNNYSKAYFSRGTIFKIYGKKVGK